MQSTDSSKVAAPAAEFKEVGFRHSRNLPSLLAQLQTSLLVRRYQAGKRATVGVRDGKLNLSLHHLDRPMGVAASQRWIAVGALNQIWLLRSARVVAPRLKSVLHFDDCLLARHSPLTGDIQCHELSYGGDELWIVDTLFSCRCTRVRNYSYVPRGRPPFITALAAEDRDQAIWNVPDVGKPSAESTATTAGGNGSPTNESKKRQRKPP